MDFNNETRVEELLNIINTDIKEKLSEKRYIHSIGVMKKAEELAKRYDADINKVRLVGLAHDIAKEMTKQEKLDYAKNNNIEVDDIESINVGLLHGKIGADICKKKYDFTQDMQDAIKFHTTGHKDMNLLSKIIFLADKIEDGRTYKDEKKMENLNYVRDIATQNLDMAILLSLDNSLIYTIQKQELIHPDSIDTRNQLILDLKSNES